MNLRWRTGDTREPIIPESGVIAPMRTREEACMCRVVFPNSIAVDVIVVKPVERSNSVVNLIGGITDRPSERRNQAARYLNVF
jgi:hypothetical protein